MTSATTFTGWPPAALDFYRGLEADNSKSYWTAYKDVYEQGVLAPMQALLAELAGEFGEGKIFRPNRDLRFSADKSPYKTAIGAVLGRGYVQFSAQGIAVGAGCHTMAPDQLDRYRIAVADDTKGTALQAVIAELADAGIDVTTRETLKSAPRGFPKDHPRAGLLRNKDLAAWKQWPAITSWVGSTGAKTHIIETLRASQPLVDWLDTNVGETTLEHRR
ncbi:DUF2461 domain-containing protein [Gryllotalpicola reticulitermitis]|uniref:DUF2461 domain-containing protein n=1 Tax=Gryllotalpicola reticulitermitis TaxID=1184153 RepID=A0ABV8Q2L7_9MICO